VSHCQDIPPPHRHCRPSKLLELKNPRPNRPFRAYKRAGAAPHLASHRPAELPCLPSLHAPPPPTTIAGHRPTPRSRLHKRFRSKVSTGLRSPRFPLRFPLFPGRRRALGRRRPPPAEGHPGLFCSGSGGRGGRRRAFCPYALPFPIFPPEPLLSIPSLSLSSKLNHNL
jgi:hypothetical protein